MADLIAHEVQLLAGMGIHIQVEGSCLGQLVMVRAKHLLQDGISAVNHLVMGKGQHKPVVVVIPHGEGQLVIHGSALIRGRTEIMQRIIHPAHIPLIVEAKTAFPYGLGDTGKGAGILRSQNNAGVHIFQSLVHSLQECHRIVVHAPVGISLPVNRPADGIHAQAVKMEFLDPEIRRRLEEAADLATGMHKVAGAPLAETQSGICILIEGCAVIICKAVGIQSKVDRNVVHDHTDAILVALVNERLQLVRSAVPGGGTEEAGTLIAPGFVAGMLVQRHDLQIVIAVFLQVRNQNVCHFLIIVPGIRAVLRFPEGTQMHLKNIQRSILMVVAAAEPLVIIKLIAVHIPDNGTELGPKLHAEAVGIAVVHPLPCLVVNAVLIYRARSRVLYGDLPESAVMDRLHRNLFFLIVKDHADLFRIGCICTKNNTLGHNMGTKVFISIKTGSIIEPTKVHS